VIRVLVGAKADIEAKDQWGSRPLIRASKAGRPDALKALIELGAQVNSQQNDKFSGIQWAAHNNHSACVKILLDNNADTEILSSSDYTALLRASQAGNVAPTKLLVEAKCNIEHTDTAGYTALMRAAQYGHPAVVQLLVEKGANIDAQAGMWNALRLAQLMTKDGHGACVDILKGL